MQVGAVLGASLGFEAWVGVRSPAGRDPRGRGRGPWCCGVTSAPDSHVLSTPEFARRFGAAPRFPVPRFLHLISVVPSPAPHFSYSILCTPFPILTFPAPLSSHLHLPNFVFSPVPLFHTLFPHPSILHPSPHPVSLTPVFCTLFCTPFPETLFPHPIPHPVSHTLVPYTLSRTPFLIPRFPLPFSHLQGQGFGVDFAFCTCSVLMPAPRSARLVHIPEAGVRCRERGSREGSE